MPNTPKEAVAEKIEIVNQLDDANRGGRKLWLIIPAALAISALAFFAVRRVFNRGAEA